MDYKQLLNHEIINVFKQWTRINLFNFNSILFLIKTYFYQKKALHIREELEKQELHIPPFLIFSITHQCNFSCTGCYQKILTHHHPHKELSTEKIKSILNEMKSLGISIALIVGGEPLLKKNLFSLLSQFPEIIFLLFTNGSLINKQKIGYLKKYKHIIPIISLEGDKVTTDKRRGMGVYNNIHQLILILKKEKIFHGLSITVTKNNFDSITDDGFIKSFLSAHGQLFFFIEYVPVEKQSENLVLTPKQNKYLLQKTQEWSKKYPALFFPFPGGEEKYEGCLSSGRGFIHINAQGIVEPCPFAPYPAADLKKVSLKEAIQSGLLKIIRENHSQLQETKGGCTLWENRKWVQSLIQNKLST